MRRNGSERHPTWRTAGCVAVVLLAWGMSGRASDAAAEAVSGNDELQMRWEYFAPIQLPAHEPGQLVDLLLDQRVFTHAEGSLADLRIYDAAGRALPFALRVLRPTQRRDPFPAKEFNRAAGPDGSSELTLDLQAEQPGRDVEHNEIEITTPGSEFRRHVVVEGSDDGATWSKLAETDLVRFRRGEQAIEGSTVTYPPSRYRQLRVRVFPDKLIEQDPVAVERVLVVRRVDVPGEFVTAEGQLGLREPSRGEGGPGSAWIIGLGGDNVPCDRIEVDVEDSEFVRDYYLEAGGPEGSRQLFQRINGGNGVWQRRAGEARQPLVATFAEVVASRLRLVVTDFRNPPLTIRSVKCSAPARQVLFVPPASSDAQLRLFFGNPDAAAPNYDFARNLPPQLPAAPARATLGNAEPNPDFVPPPQPWTERWPWLIYVVLAAASLVLAVVILSVARRAIARHDARQNRSQADPPSSATANIPPPLPNAEP
jgi:hypothetical protein